MSRIHRRDFLTGAGAAAAGAIACGAGVGLEVAGRARALAGASAGIPTVPLDPSDWASVRDSFALSPGRIHLSSLYISSHPAPVRAAIDEHRRGLDRDPVGYLQRGERALTYAALEAAGRYMDAEPGDLALTDSTTMGLGLLYSGLPLASGAEILTTEHDYYVTHEAARMAAERAGARVRKIRLYEGADAGREGIAIDADALAEAIAREVSPGTRVVALTWVHSGTGVKLPLARIAAALSDRAGERPLLCVDGVHGFGVEDEGVGGLGVDFFVAGCHKWVFGPRGTGLVWGSGADAWAQVRPSIPSFLDDGAWAAWFRGVDPPGPTTARRATPGGFKSFEHRWALAQAFDFLREIGRDRIADRTHALARRLKEGLIETPGVRLVTPLDESVSSGIVCFDVDGLTAGQTVARLEAAGIVATVTPYATSHARLAPSLVNAPEEVDAAIDAVREIAG